MEKIKCYNDKCSNILTHQVFDKNRNLCDVPCCSSDCEKIWHTDMDELNEQYISQEESLTNPEKLRG